MALKVIACVLYIFHQALGLQVSGTYGNQCGQPLGEPTSLTQQTPLGKRIVGGTEASLGTWPWMAMLKKNGRIKCGGSIIDNYILLTAAHCFTGESKYDDWEVYVGKLHVDTDRKDRYGQIHTISLVIPHVKFNNTSLMNDIAIIVLKEPIRYNRYVSPICLPTKNQPETDQCYTTGWGETYGTGYADVLKELRLPPKMLSFCRILLNKLGKSKLQNVFCAGYQNADACSGDSGGPYSCKINGKWYLKGIVSFGPDCANPGWAGFYVNVTAYIRWITKVRTLINNHIST